MKKEQFTSLFQKLRPRLKSRAERIVGNSDDASDAVQNAFCRLWGERIAGYTERNAEAVMMTTVKNLSIDIVRSRAAHRAEELDDKAGEASAEPELDAAEEIYAKVERLLSTRVDPLHREILLHRERDGWDYGDIAHHYGISEANARQIVARTRMKIRQLYKDLKS